VTRGGAVRTILAESRAWRADLVVIGRRGMSGLERMLLGSVAERVLHGAPCAVFCGHRATVPAGARASYIA
jgi:nucleotide-binding universal stress UspA family protein